MLDPADAPGVTAADYQNLAAGYTSVGKVGGSGQAGSGVLISDRWVLTAGHVSIGKAGGTFTIGGNTYTVSTATTYPGFFSTSVGNDLGLLYLSAPVTGVDPAIMLSTQGGLMGESSVWVGYGFTGNGTTGYSFALNEKRAFTNVIDFYGPKYGVASTSFVSDFDRPGDPTSNAEDSNPSATTLEGNVAPGDSGGGVFIKRGGKDYLVGTISYLASFDGTGNADYGDLSGATNLDLYYSWIAQQTGIQAVPEPSVGLLAAMPLLLCWHRRRQRQEEG
ncbi:trypsin-like serine protease [Luteolibacter sp. LG18]|uniref:trypsin-like serine protease n=1 Tax=Luteolibacter sp. LG18 TaxID=2819286 RepID=UPI0030C7441F